MSEEIQKMKKEVFDEWLKAEKADWAESECFYYSSRDVIDMTKGIIEMDAVDIYNFMRDAGAELVERGDVMKWKIKV